MLSVVLSCLLISTFFKRICLFSTVFTILKNKKMSAPNAPNISSSKKESAKKRLKKLKYKKHPNKSDKKRVGAATDESSISEDETRSVLGENPTYLMPDEEPLDRGQNFATLMSLPSNKDTQFVTKSYQNWSTDIAKYSDLFELNIHFLNAGIRCIPFADCIDLDKEYFTKDQLTQMQNDTEEAKLIYEKDMKSQINKSQSSKSPEKNPTEHLEEDLDFLLSLNEPIGPGICTDSVKASKNADKKMTKGAMETKSVNLEKWLDSVLDDE